SVRKQLSSWFGLEAAANRGRIFAHNEGGAKTYLHPWGAPAPTPDPAGYESAETSVQYSASLNGVFQLATIDFLRRENAVNFYASVGFGVLAFNPVLYTDADGSTGAWDNSGNWGQERGDGAELTGENDFKKATNIPVGVGVK